MLHRALANYLIVASFVIIGHLNKKTFMPVADFGPIRGTSLSLFLPLSLSPSLLHTIMFPELAK